MIKTIDLPLEVDKTYKTKFQTKDTFTIRRIDKKSTGVIITVWGIYDSHPDLGICPLSPERIIPDKMEVESIDEQKIDRIKEALNILSDDERMLLFSHFCKHCGSTNPKCRCWDDT